MMPRLRILIVDANEVRATIIEEGLREAGYEQLIRISATTGLVAAIEANDPDVVVIDLEDPSRDALADMFLVSRHVRRPITMFVDHSDFASIEAAVEAGVSAYIVDGLKKERMQAILQTCISRFNAFPDRMPGDGPARDEPACRYGSLLALRRQGMPCVAGRLQCAPRVVSRGMV